MDLETLRYFRYIAKYKNITSAAKHLFVSQSTLSRHIMALENELGVKLFERTNKQIELTEAGRVFYNDSASFIGHMESVVKNVKYAAKGYTGVLRIAQPNCLYDILSKPIEQIKREYPTVQLILEGYDFNEIPSAVRHDFYHLGVTCDFEYWNQTSPDTEEFEVIPVQKTRFVLAIPTEYVSHSDRETIANVVGNLALIQPSYAEPPFLKNILTGLEEMTGSKIGQIVHVNTTESLLLNVSAGLGYGIVPLSWQTVCKGRDEITFMELETLDNESELVMLYKRANSSELLRRFIEIVKEYGIQ